MRNDETEELENMVQYTKMWSVCKKRWV
jgi:hypothetical protein